VRAVYYHSVVSEAALGFHPVDALEPAQVEAHVRELTRHWCVLSLAEIVEHLNEGQALPPRAVHISFDDGFRDNLVAADILDHHRLPWTLFVVTDAVLDGFLPWYVRLGQSLASAQGVVAWRGDHYELGRPTGRSKFKSRVKSAVLAAPASSHLDVLHAVLTEAGLASVAAPSPFMVVDEVRQLAAAGVEIGNHSATHCNLSRCSAPELKREVEESQARLAAALGRPVPFFAYPDGRCDPHVIRLVAGSHEAAMATWTARRPLHPHRLRRYPVGASVEALREVLDPAYPARFRARRAKWAARRALRRIQQPLPTKRSTACT
jgi:peptidoglycan/xylan/chitin deacetylase (PgdA/CDA1 family)